MEKLMKKEVCEIALFGAIMMIWFLAARVDAQTCCNIEGACGNIPACSVGVLQKDDKYCWDVDCKVKDEAACIAHGPVMCWSQGFNDSVCEDVPECELICRTFCARGYYKE